MITPENFPQANCTYKGDGEEIKDLHTCVAKNNNPELPEGANYVVSKWKLTPEDIQRINETGEIWLVTMGRGVAPTRLHSENPFETEGYEPVNLEQENAGDEPVNPRLN